MKYLLPLFIIAISCTKKVGHLAEKAAIPGNQNTNACAVLAFVSYSTNIKSIIDANCLPCHSSPGSGGINLDSYASVKTVVQSGQLMPVITNTDPANPIMPPPPQNRLDSCQVKAITLWINSGYSN